MSIIASDVGVWIYEARYYQGRYPMERRGDNATIYFNIKLGGCFLLCTNDSTVTNPSYRKLGRQRWKT
jgi:hypothetical protein